VNLPLFIEESKVPVFLSYFSPITINAITLGPFVFSRSVISEKTRRHETIHWEQYKETLIIGFLVFYLMSWLWGILKYRSGKIAYYQIPFEQEAYSNDDDWVYLLNRKKYTWLKYKI